MIKMEKVTDEQIKFIVERLKVGKVSLMLLVLFY